MAFDDKQLAEWYQQFSRNHNRLREELLERLAAQRSAEEGKPVTPATARRRSTKQRKLAWLAIAASLLALVAGFLVLPNRSTARTFTIYDLPQVLRKARSIYVRGWHYHHPGFDTSKPAERYPLELYFERPGRYWHSNLMFTDEYVSTNYFRGDGDRYAIVWERPATVVTGKDLPLDAELHVANAIDNILGFSSLSERGGYSRYQLTGSEEIGGQQLDIYQQSVESDGVTTIETVWLDPQTGHPAKTSIVEHRADGSTEKLIEYDSIIIDGQAPEHLFERPLPEGGQRHEIDKVASYVGMLMVQNAFTVRYALNIDGQAVLYCWGSPNADEERMTREEVSGLLPTVEFLGPDSDCAAHQEILRIDRSDDRNWIWMLARPMDESQSVNDCILKFVENQDGGGTVDFRRPLLFDEGRLETLIQELATTTAANSDHIIALPSLQDLRQRIGSGFKLQTKKL